MQFSISREAFLKSLQRVVGAVGRRPNMPILSNVLLVVKNQLLSLTGTDLELELVSRVPLATPSVGGEITLPARKLLDVCKAFSDGVMIDFSLAEKGQKALIKSGKSRFTIAGLSAEDFPKVEDGPGVLEFSLDMQEIRTLIDSTSFAMAQQDVRYYLNGLLIDIQSGSLRAVAADGHRLATTSLSPKHPISLSEPQAIIIPRKAIVEIQRLFSEGNEAVGLKIGAQHLRAITTEFSFCTKLVDGQFPDYRKVLPGTQCFEAIIERTLFKQCLQRVAVLFSDKHRGACVQLENNLLKILAINADKDQVEEEFEIQYTGPAMEIGFNVSYIIDYLNTGSSAFVKMKFIDPNQSVTFEPEHQAKALSESLSDLSSTLAPESQVGADPLQNSLYVVMPVKL